MQDYKSSINELDGVISIVRNNKTSFVCHSSVDNQARWTISCTSLPCQELPKSLKWELVLDYYAADPLRLSHSGSRLTWKEFVRRVRFALDNDEIFPVFDSNDNTKLRLDLWGATDDISAHTTSDETSADNDLDEKPWSLSLVLKLVTSSTDELTSLIFNLVRSVRHSQRALKRKLEKEKDSSSTSQNVAAYSGIVQACMVGDNSQMKQLRNRPAKRKPGTSLVNPRVKRHAPKRTKIAEEDDDE